MSDNNQQFNIAGLPKMRYCTNCVYPASSAVPLASDENGVCSGCRTANQRIEIEWNRRKRAFER